MGPRRRLPVWSGSDPWYDGSAFARDGVVCVTSTTAWVPLGFGFFDELFPDLGRRCEPRAARPVDAALRWVQENVAAFGGDPGNVTVFGQSVGAMSICALMASGPAGLFRRAILRAGTPGRACPLEGRHRGHPVACSHGWASRR